MWEQDWQGSFCSTSSQSVKTFEDYRRKRHYLSFAHLQTGSTEKNYFSEPDLQYLKQFILKIFIEYSASTFDLC